MNLKIGIIGTNFISDLFCEAAAQVPDAVLYAVYSRKEETGTTFAQNTWLPPTSLIAVRPLRHWNTANMSSARRSWQ